MSNATSLRSHDVAAAGISGGAGGDGRFIGGSYRGGCATCNGLAVADPSIHRAMLSQQPQQTSDIPCLRPR